MAIKQLSIFVENKRGRLVEITKMLADSGVNMRALSIADTRDFGILRLIVDDTQKACLVKITDVVAVEMPHRTGSLNAALTVLNDAGINVEYLYAFLSSSGQGAYVVLRVADNAQAEQALKDAGYNVLSDEDQIE